MGYIIAICVMTVVTILACCKVSGDCAREEEKEHPCENCQRWSECNGVDDQCPWRKKDA